MYCRVCNSTTQLLHCAACKLAVYCSTECQTKDWHKEHKVACPIASALLNIAARGDKRKKASNNEEEQRKKAKSDTDRLRDVLRTNLESFNTLSREAFMLTVGLNLPAEELYMLSIYSVAPPDEEKNKRVYSPFMREFPPIDNFWKTWLKQHKIKIPARLPKDVDYFKLFFAHVEKNVEPKFEGIKFVDIKINNTQYIPDFFSGCSSFLKWVFNLIPTYVKQILGTSVISFLIAYGLYSLDCYQTTEHIPYDIEALLKGLDKALEVTPTPTAT